MERRSISRRALLRSGAVALGYTTLSPLFSLPIAAAPGSDGRGRVIVVSDLAGTVADRVKRPGDTVMFTDSAFVNDQLIEYSFAEPRFHPSYGSRADPSIHFRHAQRANVAWCDGSVRREMRTHTWSSGNYPGDPNHWGIGWFGASDDNSLFDLR